MLFITLILERTVFTSCALNAKYGATIAMRIETDVNYDYSRYGFETTDGKIFAAEVNGSGIVAFIANETGRYIPFMELNGSDSKYPMLSVTCKNLRRFDDYQHLSLILVLFMISLVVFAIWVWNWRAKKTFFALHRDITVLMSVTAVKHIVWLLSYFSKQGSDRTEGEVLFGMITVVHVLDLVFVSSKICCGSGISQNAELPDSPTLVCFGVLGALYCMSVFAHPGGSLSAPNYAPITMIVCVTLFFIVFFVSFSIVVWRRLTRVREQIKAHLYAIYKDGIACKTTPIYKKYKRVKLLHAALMIYFIMHTCVMIISEILRHAQTNQMIPMIVLDILMNITFLSLCYLRRDNAEIYFIDGHTSRYEQHRFTYNELAEFVLSDEILQTGEEFDSFTIENLPLPPLLVL